jgi:hypothetical protein
LGGGSGKPQADRVFREFRKAQERFIRKHHGAFGLLIYRLALVTGACIRITAFGILAVIRPSRRERNRDLVRLWCRILSWTIGFRGPGLSGCTGRATVGDAIRC